MRSHGYVSLTLAFVAIFTFGAVAPFDYIYQLQVLSLAGLIALQAIGLNLLLGGTGQISLGQVGFMGVGAYTSGALLKLEGWPFLAAFVVATLLAGVFGFLVGYIALRLRGHYLAMATLAFGGIVFGLINEIEITGGPLGMLRIPPMDFAGFRILSPHDKYLVIWGITAVATAAVISLLHSRVGRALAAIRDDEVAASAMGINVARYKIAIFVFASMLSGMAGSLYASYLGGLAPLRFGILESVMLLVVVAVGGLRSVSGTVFAAIILTALPEFLRQYEEYRPTAYAVALILLIILFPGGIGRVLQLTELAIARSLAAMLRGAAAARPRKDA
ncbi:MAG: branched-chain amino acid ABC transporter permease [Rhodospirillales bacterium]|nr:branched-chain amino acid ABC transporter permease [Rhodospirillales bacterium]